MHPLSDFEKLAFKINIISKFLRDSEDLLCNSLMSLSGVDDANGEKEKDENGFETIKGGTLSVWYNLESIKLNTDENQATARRFQIMSIPTMMLFKDGERVDGFVGVMSLESIEQRVSKFL